MTRRLVVRPEAEVDIDLAAAWLEERSPRSAAKFWRAVDRGLAQIRDNPFQYQKVAGQARRALVRDFRYTIIYVVTENEIIVVACMHGSRHPQRWRDRIPE